ncbi:MAG: DNA polymerase III subunit delta [Clostridia bacterium]|nr:DNA polymerase III subunit delta [Clostridia bacterium]
MTPTEFGKLIKSDLHGVFLFYGEEQYLKQHYLGLAKKSACENGDSSISISGEGRSLDDICIELSQTASMPSLDMSKRFIVIYDVEWKKVKEEQLGYLEDCASELKDYDDVVVIIDTRPENFDAGTEKKPSKLLNALSKQIQCVNFPKETPARLAAWIQKHFTANKIQASPDTCNTLIKYCGRDMTTLNHEITKLSAYVLQNGRNTVTPEDIRYVSCFNNEIDTFDFKNAILNGNSERAFSILSEMILHKEAPELILGTIMKIYTDLYTVKTLNESGMMKSDISKKTGIHEYSVGLYMQRTASLSKVGLEKALDLCKEADSKIKSSSLDSYETIEILLIKLFMTGRLR